jgi:hypothetical protein
VVATEFPEKAEIPIGRCQILQYLVETTNFTGRAFEAYGKTQDVRLVNSNGTVLDLA